jgi:hypothetical protein
MQPWGAREGQSLAHSTMARGAVPRTWTPVHPTCRWGAPRPRLPGLPGDSTRLLRLPASGGESAVSSGFASLGAVYSDRAPRSEDGNGSSQTGVKAPSPLAAALPITGVTRMSQEEAGSTTSTSPATDSGIPYLSNRDIDRLTNYKWRYSLESHGFSSGEASRLLFMRWLYRQRTMHG